MEYIKDSLYNTKLPVLKIDEAKLYNEYPQIGAGSEGLVHKYNDDIAFKTFVFTPEKDKLLRKFEKIEALGKESNIDDLRKSYYELDKLSFPYEIDNENDHNLIGRSK